MSTNGNSVYYIENMEGKSTRRRINTKNRHRSIDLKLRKSELAGVLLEVDGEKIVCYHIDDCLLVYLYIFTI